MISESFRANSNIDHKDDRKNRGMNDAAMAAPPRNKVARLFRGIGPQLLSQTEGHK